MWQITNKAINYFIQKFNQVFSYYLDIWKISNITPVHKKNGKQLVNNYLPISLLPISGKISEKIIFNRNYNFLLEEELLNSNQFGFQEAATGGVL